MNKHFNSLSKCSQKLQVKSQLAKPLISIYSPVIFCESFYLLFWIPYTKLDLYTCSPFPHSNKEKVGSKWEDLVLIKLIKPKIMNHFGATGHAIHAMLTYNVNLNLILHLNHKVVQSNLSYVTFQGNVEIWSHNTGGR